MEKRQYDLCLEVLRRFHKQKLLSQFILIGSWCVIFYEKYFSDPDYLSRIKLVTRDMDFLIDRPQEIKVKVDIPALLKDLGFLVSFKGRDGYIKLDHPELILEFLTPERGRGREKPFPLPTLGVNATALRFLNFLADNTIRVKVEDFVVQLPHPAHFGLHKLIVAARRTKKEKALKDKEAAMVVLHTLVLNHQTQSITDTFQNIPVKWQTKILESLRGTDQEILDLLR